MDVTRPLVAVVQDYIPHYRLPLFQRLASQSQFRWEFLSGNHPGRGDSGLAVETYSGIVHHSINVHRLGRFVWQSGIAHWIARQAYDAIILSLSWPTISNQFSFIAAKRCRGAKVIGWSKGIPESGQPRSSWRQLYERMLIRQCDALIVYGQVSAAYFRGLGYPNSQIFVAQNAIDVSRIYNELPEIKLRANQIRQDLHLGSEMIVGYFGRLAAEKRVDWLVDAFDNAVSRGLRARLLIAGDGPEREHLEQLDSSVASSDRILFIGRVPIEEQDSIMHLIDVYVSCRSAGLAILEVMAHGNIALITPEQRPETELIEGGVTGYVTKDFSSSSISDGLLLIQKDLDMNRIDIGRQAQKVVLNKASLECMVHSFDAAVASCLDRGEI